jgi:hypothetical protein
MSLQLAAASYIYIHYPLKKKRKEQRWWRVTMHVHTCSGRNGIIPLMRRPNTDNTPSKPLTLPLNQLLIRYVVTSPVHTVTIRCYGTRNVTSVYPPLVVTLRTTRFNVRKFCVVLTLCLCIMCESQNKQRLLAHIALIDWFRVTEMERVYCAVRAESLYET